MIYWCGDYYCEMTINLLPMKVCLKRLKEVTYTLREKLQDFMSINCSFFPQMFLYVQQSACILGKAKTVMLALVPYVQPH